MLRSVMKTKMFPLIVLCFFFHPLYFFYEKRCISLCCRQCFLLPPSPLLLAPNSNFVQVNYFKLDENIFNVPVRRKPATKAKSVTHSAHYSHKRLAGDFSCCCFFNVFDLGSHKFAEIIQID
jgi:hypothetical protein